MFKKLIISRVRVPSVISVANKWFVAPAPYKKTMSSCKPCENSDALRNLFSEAVKAVQPATLINNQVKLIDGHLSVNDRTYPVPSSCYVVGFGKAVLGMAVELEQTLGDRLERAIVTVPKGIFQNYPQFLGKNSKIWFIEGAENNIPDKEAVEGAEKIKKLVKRLGKDDLLIVLVSGGGSALLPLPKPPITLEEKQAIIKGLSRGGATIQELNTVRKQLSILKGGGLAELAYPCKVVSLILSDIVDDPIDLIASGPTVYSEKRPDEAIETTALSPKIGQVSVSILNIFSYRAENRRVGITNI